MKRPGRVAILVTRRDQCGGALPNTGSTQLRLIQAGVKKRFDIGRAGKAQPERTTGRRHLQQEVEKGATAAFERDEVGDSGILVRGLADGIAIGELLALLGGDAAQIGGLGQLRRPGGRVRAVRSHARDSAVEGSASAGRDASSQAPGAPRGASRPMRFVIARSR